MGYKPTVNDNEKDNPYQVGNDSPQTPISNFFEEYTPTDIITGQDEFGNDIVEEFNVSNYADGIYTKLAGGKTVFGDYGWGNVNMNISSLNDSIIISKSKNNFDLKVNMDSIQEKITFGSGLSYNQETRELGVIGTGGVEYIAGDGIEIENGVISSTIDIEDFQEKLTAGTNVTIDGNKISAVDTKYTLPTASSTVLGGVKIGNNLIIDQDGVLSAVDLDTTYSAGDNIQIVGGVISATDTKYSLPKASTTTLGGIIVGDNLTITDGVLSATDLDTKYTAGSNIQIVDGKITATDTKYTAGTNVTIDGNKISAVDTKYTLPTASSTVLGGVKIGNNLTITDGVLSAVDLDTKYTAGDGISINENGVISNTSNIFICEAGTTGYSALNNAIENNANKPLIICRVEQTSGESKEVIQTSMFIKKVGSEEINFYAPNDTGTGIELELISKIDSSNEWWIKGMV